MKTKKIKRAEISTYYQSLICPTCEGSTDSGEAVAVEIRDDSRLLGVTIGLTRRFIYICPNCYIDFVKKVGGK